MPKQFIVIMNKYREPRAWFDDYFKHGHGFFWKYIALDFKAEASLKLGKTAWITIGINRRINANKYVNDFLYFNNMCNYVSLYSV